MGIDRKAAVLERLDIAAVVREFRPDMQLTGNDQALVRCPSHDDATASDSLNLKTGLHHCFACGASGNFFDWYMLVSGCDFKTALHELETFAGITTLPKVKPRKVATFIYTDAAGKKRYGKERWEPARDGKRKKEFFFFSFDKQGNKEKGFKGEHLLYRLHEIVPAEQVFILEGEAKADLLAAWGLAATCLDTGAESKWKASYTPHLAGKDIVIVPDNDQAGEAYLQTVARALHGVARSIRVLRLPGLIEKQDVIDWARLQEGAA